LDLPHRAAAQRAADEIARRTGRVVVVTDEHGDEVCIGRPTPIRRNEIIVRPPMLDHDHTVRHWHMTARTARQMSGLMMANILVL
jgi:hypothetical protein